MADNIAVRPSTATTKVTVATDEISSVHYPIYKTAYGANGSVQTFAERDMPSRAEHDEELIIMLAGLAEGGP